MLLVACGLFVFGSSTVLVRHRGKWTARIVFGTLDPLKMNALYLSVSLCISLSLSLCEETSPHVDVFNGGFAVHAADSIFMSLSWSRICFAKSSGDPRDVLRNL